MNSKKESIEIADGRQFGAVGAIRSLLPTRYSMTFIVAIIATLAAHASSKENASTSGPGFRIDVTNNSQLLIRRGNGSGRIRVEHEVFGYEVNCDKTRILAWGKPKNLNKDNPQETILTTVDVGSNLMISAIAFSKNVFDVTFLSDGANAIIALDTEQTLNIALGTLESSSVSGFSNGTGDTESCAPFPYKSYRKYKN